MAEDTTGATQGDQSGAGTGDQSLPAFDPVAAEAFFKDLISRYTTDDDQIILDLISFHPLTKFDEKEFCDLLKHSLSLSVAEKKRVVDAVPTLSQYQIDELKKVFTEEREEFRKLMPKEGETINHQIYLKDNIRPLVRVLNEQRPQCGTKNLKFLHDNARPHIHQSVIAYLESQNFTIMDHPPYSPDLAPSDFWLFNYIKERLSDHTTVKSLTRQITEIVSSIPEKEYRKTFDKWLERMECCIKNKGHYFEHLLK